MDSNENVDVVDGSENVGVLAPATDLTGPGDDKEDVISRAIISNYSQCAGCSEDLQSDATESRPRLLPCLHSACSKCVTNMLSADGNTVTCSTCHYVGHASYIVNNLLLMSSSDQANAQNDTTATRYCTGCGENENTSVEATHFCVDCQEFLCEACRDAHKRVKVTKEHIVQAKGTTWAMGGPSAERSATRFHPEPRCPCHPQEPLKLYCETCTQLTCRDCQLSTEHKEHSYKFLPDAAAMCRSYVGRLVGRLKEKRLYVESAKCLIERRRADISEKEESVTLAIKNFILRLIREINNRGRTLVCDLKSVCEAKRRQLEQKHVEIQQLTTSLSHCLEFTELALQSNSDAALLHCHRVLAHRLSAILQERCEVPNPYHVVDLRFDENQSLLGALSSLGRVFVDGASLAPSTVMTMNRSGTSGSNAENSQRSLSAINPPVSGLNFSSGTTAATARNDTPTIDNKFILQTHRALKNYLSTGGNRSSPSSVMSSNFAVPYSQVTKVTTRTGAAGFSSTTGVASVSEAQRRIGSMSVTQKLMLLRHMRRNFSQNRSSTAANGDLSSTDLALCSVPNVTSHNRHLPFNVMPPRSYVERAAGHLGSLSSMTHIDRDQANQFFVSESTSPQHDFWLNQHDSSQNGSTLINQTYFQQPSAVRRSSSGEEREVKQEIGSYWNTPFLPIVIEPTEYSNESGSNDDNCANDSRFQISSFDKTSNSFQAFSNSLSDSGVNLNRTSLLSNRCSSSNSDVVEELLSCLTGKGESSEPERTVEFFSTDSSDVSRMTNVRPTSTRNKIIQELVESMNDTTSEDSAILDTPPTRLINGLQNSKSMENLDKLNTGEEQRCGSVPTQLLTLIGSEIAPISVEDDDDDHDMEPALKKQCQSLNCESRSSASGCNGNYELMKLLSDTQDEMLSIDNDSSSIGGSQNAVIDASNELSRPDVL